MWFLFGGIILWTLQISLKRAKLLLNCMGLEYLLYRFMFVPLYWIFLFCLFIFFYLFKKKLFWFSQMHANWNEHHFLVIMYVVFNLKCLAQEFCSVTFLLSCCWMTICTWEFMLLEGGVPPWSYFVAQNNSQSKITILIICNR